jgi:hypothetical protein
MAIARMLNFRRFYHPAAASGIALLILACAVALVAAPQRAGKPAPAAPMTTSSPVAPFRAGEALNYSGQWLSMNEVVTAQLSVIDDHPFFGHPAWHLQAKLQTRNPLRYLFPVDDQFDSYASRADFAGMQFEMYQHEAGKQENRVLRFSSVPMPAPAGATEVQVLPGTRDPLGFIYYLRTVNWKQTPEVRSPVYDGHKLYEVRASATADQRDVTGQAGTFVTTGVTLRIFDHDAEVTEIKVTFWLAQDAAHTPVLIEAELPFGTGRVELMPPAS